MFGFLKPAPDAEQKISEEKVPRLYKMWQTRVLISTAIVYIGYYIIRLIIDPNLTTGNYIIYDNN